MPKDSRVKSQRFVWRTKCLSDALCQSPSILSFFRLWLIALMILYVLAPTTIIGLNKMTGLIGFSLLYWVVFVKGKRCIVENSRPRAWSLTTLAILFIVEFFTANYAGSYYTGSSLVEAAGAVLSGANTYGSYQAHFLAANIRSTPIFDKLPAILSLAIAKGVFLMVASELFQRVRFGLHSLIVLLIFTVPILLFCAARGTFFEVFEIVLGIIYFALATNAGRFISPAKKMAGLGAVAVGFIVLVWLFAINTARRFGSFDAYLNRDCFTNFCFSPYGFFEAGEYLLFQISTYFSMGAYFISEYIKAIISGELVHSLIPGYYLLSGEGVYGLKKEMCGVYFDCGGVWVPEIFQLISIFGVFTIAFIPVLLLMARRFELLVLRHNNRFSLPLLYLVLVFFVSLPVGKFYIGTSANIINTVVFIMLWAGSAFLVKNRHFLLNIQVRRGRRSNMDRGAS